MKKITLWIFVLFAVTQVNAQLWTITECLATVDSNIYGPMYSTANAGSTNRSAALYPSSQLTGIAGQTLNSLYYKRLTATGSMSGTPNFKVYMKEVSISDYGSGALDWATEISTATLVYDSDPSASVGSSSGWKSFPMSTPFTYSGAQNLAVFTEYSNSSASSNIGWAYEFTAPCITTSNSNTGKYSNNTTGTLPTSLGTSNYRRPLIGFDFNVSCNAPNSLAFSNLTTNSVDVTWVENSIQPQDGYEYYNSTSDVAPLPTQVPTGVTSTGITSVSLSSLTPGTIYYFWVRGNCGAADKSIWLGPLTYTTGCVETASFSENFDNSPTGAGNLPPCWSKLGTSNNVYTTTGADSPMSPANRLYMNITTSNTAFALMPPVTTLQANTHRLKFKAYATTTNKIVSVGYFLTPGDINTFIEIEALQLPSNNLASTEDFLIIPTGIPAGVNQLVFTIPAGIATTLYIDDVVWEPIPACVEPISLASGTITANSVGLSWLEMGTASTWNIEYGPVGYTQGTGTVVSGVTTNPYTLTGLSANTVYDIYVQADCGGTDGTSPWTGPISIQTQCAEVAAFVENFDSSPTGTGNLPDCWSKLGTSNNVYTTTASAAPMSPANRLYMNISTTTTAYAVLPPVSTLQANTHRLKFKAYATSTNKVLSVGYLTTPGDVNTFIEIEAIQLPGTSLDSTGDFLIIPSGIPAGVNQLVFTITPGATTTVYIDDVIWEAIPACVEPIGPTSANITSNSAELSWLEMGTATTWNIEYGPTGYTQGSGTTVSGVTSNPYVLMSLSPATTYDYYVQADCGSTDGVSTWVGPYTFTTECVEVSAFVENFDTTPTGLGNLPVCWSKLGTSNNVYTTTGGAAPMSPANRLYMNISTTSTAYAVLPPVSNLQANTHRLRFKGYATTSNKVLRVGYLTTPGDETTFVEIEPIQMPSANLASTQEFTIIPTAIPAGVNQLVFNILPGATTTMYIDDVKWEVNSLCVEPSDLTASMVTNETATLGWTAGGPETVWDIQHGLTGFALGSGTIVSGLTSNSYLLSGLTPNTSYEFYVRGVCTGPENSSWSGPYLFHTQCNDVTDFIEVFEPYATGSGTPMPDCWGRLGNGLTYMTTGSVAPMSPTNRLYMSASGTTPTVACAVLPAVSNLQANTHWLKFKAYATTANKVISIGYLLDNSDLSSFVELQEIPLPSTSASTAQEFIVSPNGVPAGVKNLAIRNSGSSSGTTVAYIDDVIWEPIPACPDPTFPGATNIGSTSADLTWIEMGSATTWNIEYGPTGYTQGTGGTLLSGITANPYSLTALSPATSYDFYVQADCGTSGTTSWVGPYTFTTLCLPIAAPYLENFDSLALVTPYTDLPNCWEPQIGPDFWDVTNDLVNTGHTYLPNIGDHTTGNSNYMWIDSSTDITANEMVSPLIDMSALTNPYVGFWFASNNTDNTINHTIALDVWDGTSWLNLATETGNFSSWVEVAAAVPSTVPTITKFRIYAIANPLGTTANYFYNDLGVDDFFVIEEPTCLAPTGLTATNITTTTADLGWTENGTATTWDIEWGAFGFTPTGTPNIAATTTNPHNLTGLTENTYYSFYVRANCGGTDGESTWAGPFSFFTACGIANVPYTMDFESALVPNLPNCTTLQNLGTGNLWTVASNPGSGFTTNALQYLYSLTNPANVWFYTQGVNLVAGTTYAVAFDYGSNSTSYVEKLKVAYGTSADATSMTNVIVDLPSISNNTPINSSTQFTPTTSGVYYFGFNVYSDANQFNLYVDNIEVDVFLNTNTFDNNSFVAYPNPVKDVLNLSYTSDISSVRVVNLLGQVVLIKNVGATSTQLDMTNLAAGAYIVNVKVGDNEKSIKIIKQ